MNLDPRWMVSLSTLADTPGVVATVVVGRNKNTSTRRFRAIPSGVVSSARGCVLPTPVTTIAGSGTPLPFRKRFTASARLIDSGVAPAALPVVLELPITFTRSNGLSRNSVTHRAAAGSSVARCSARRSLLPTL